MSTKFGLLIDFDLLKAAISKNAKPEIVFLRFGRHIALSKMAAMAAQYYFRFRICYRCLQKVKVYEQTKFRRHISIDGRDIATSIFDKQTSAILEIYFRFRFRPFTRNLHIILHQAIPKFVQIEAFTAEI